MDGPMHKSTCSSTKTIQARGESSSVQELDPQTYSSLLEKLQASWLSNLGQKRRIHANPTPVGKKRSSLTTQFQNF